MVKKCAARADGANSVAMVVAGMENMPFRDASFDVALAMGVLEYADAGAALAEITRVLRPDGRLLATMLNPMSPYRLVEWHVYWPLLRMLGRVERWLHVPPDVRHGAADTGIRAYRERTFREMLVLAGMSTKDVVYYDVTVLVPPIDRVARRLAHRWHEYPERTVSRGWQSISAPPSWSSPPPHQAPAACPYPMPVCADEQGRRHEPADVPITRAVLVIPGPESVTGGHEFGVSPRPSEGAR